MNVEINKEEQYIIIGNTKYYGIASELLDYITKLQQENKKIRKMNKAKHKYAMQMEDNYIHERYTNLKAIEYINNHKKQLHHSFDEPSFDYLLCVNADELLNILEGNEVKS